MIFNIEDSVYREANSTPLTPEDVACDMIQLVRDTGFFDEVPEGTDLVKWAECHRVCDIYCKSGVFLMICFWLFMRSLIVVIDDFEARKKFVIDNLLYAFNPNRAVCRLLRLDLYRDASRLGHIYELSVRDETKVKEIFGDMKFDVVVGNPPYNDDMYLDFVKLGHKLSKQYSLWITPAKFMGAPSKSNISFRATILHKISKVVYFPESYDIFDILEACGICYYLIDTKHVGDAVVVNSSTFMPLLNGSSVKRDLVSITTLLNIGAEVISKLPRSSFSFSSDYDGRYNVWVTNMPGYGGGSTSKHFFSNDKNAQVIQRYEILDRDQSYSAKQAKIVFSSDRYDECLSFVSYLYSKFVRFLVYCGFCTTAPLNDATFRFVPSQVLFDTTYEDKPLDGYTPDENGEYIDSDGNKHCSLYVKYKLTDEEINVIESVIRERK